MKVKKYKNETRIMAKDAEEFLRSPTNNERNHIPLTFWPMMFFFYVPCIFRRLEIMAIHNFLYFLALSNISPFTSFPLFVRVLSFIPTNAVNRLFPLPSLCHVSVFTLYDNFPHYPLRNWNIFIIEDISFHLVYMTSIFICICFLSLRYEDGSDELYRI